MKRQVFENPKWSMSRQGRALELFASNSIADIAADSAILWIGGVHGDEPEGVTLTQHTLHWLMDDARKSHPEARHPWIVIPILNPDGFAAQQRVNGAGVDLNRNFPTRNWSPDSKSPRYFPGPNPGSEPEIQSLTALILSLRPRLIVHCHSWNPCVVLTGAPGLPAAQHLAEASGYAITNDIGYPTPGSLSEFGWHENQIPVICIEEQEHVDLQTVWPRFKRGVIKVFTT